MVIYSFYQYYKIVFLITQVSYRFLVLEFSTLIFANRKRGPQNKWPINILKHTSVPKVGIVDILNGFSISTCK